MSGSKSSSAPPGNNIDAAANNTVAVTATTTTSRSRNSRNTIAPSALPLLRQARILLLAIIIPIFTLNIWNTTEKLAGSFPSLDVGFGPPELFSSQSTTNNNDNSKNNGNNGVRICPGVWDFYPNNKSNRTLLEKLYWEAHDYHNTGGNLEAMEKFLNKALDYTYDKRGFTPFVFNDNSEAANKKRKAEHPTSVSEQIKAQLRKEDTGNRGGYTQRNLPGKFTGPGATKQFMADEGNGRMTNVLEPPTQERWDIAIGPTLPQDSCLGYHVIRGLANRRYEDKYICGWGHGPYLTKQERIVQGEYYDFTIKKSNEKKESACHIVSIGSNDQWGFEEGIVSHTDCKVATFDCTVTHPRHKPKTDRVQFYSSCISATAESYVMNGRNYTGYFDLLDLANFVNLNKNNNNSHTTTKNLSNTTGDDEILLMHHQKEQKSPSSPTQQQSTTTTNTRINYMKMDVEGYEYGVLTNMLRQARSRNLWHLLPDQLQIEFHYSTWMYDLGWSLRTRDVGELSAFFGMLFREGGYMPVHVDQQVWPSLREILFLRMYC